MTKVAMFMSKKEGQNVEKKWRLNALLDTQLDQVNGGTISDWMQL